MSKYCWLSGDLLTLMNSMDMVSPTLRNTVKQLASVAVSGSICGEQPVTIATANVQMQVSKGWLSEQKCV